MSIIHKKQSDTSERKILTDGGLSFAAVEAYKALRTNLVFSLSTKKNKAFAITSTSAGEGKSSCAANLAITFAQADMKVLLIDCDMRKPVQHKNFNVGNKYGLSTLLGGIHSLKEVLHVNVVQNLDLITCGTIPPNPSEMLASDNMSVLLNQLSTRYDYIILDTPPIGVVTDALTFAKNIGGIALVTRSEVATFDMINKSLESIRLADTDFLGFIVTDIAYSGGTYKKGYKYKYGSKGYGGYGSYGYGNENINPTGIPRK